MPLNGENLLMECDIIIQPVDSVDMKLICEPGIAKELSDYFTFKVPGYQFMPAYRNKMWDGTIKLYNIYRQTLYRGLEKYIIEFAKERNYSIKSEISKREKQISFSDLKPFIEKEIKPSINGDEINIFEHQLDSILHSINDDRCLLLSPTGSGKSLIIYCLLRYYLNILPKDKKVLIVVPTKSLVSQMISDFAEYSKLNGFDIPQNCHYIFAGKDKDTDKRVVVSTWQSIYKLPKKWFEQFGAVFGDECHLFKSKSLTTLMTKLTDCRYRIGTTGTLDGTQTHKLVIEGLFGPVYDVTSTKKLIDKNLLSELNIDCILLEYEESLRKSIKGMTYQEEMDWLTTNNERNEFISDLTSNTKGNTLVLFQYVEKHGKKLFERIKTANKEKKVFFVYGGTDVDQREKTRKLVEDEENAIIVASYGTFSTGINIKKLHNIVFASPSKSRVRILQSIGRQLRKHETKDKAKLYDIGDDLHWKSYKNHTLKHFVERIKIYNSEGFDYRMIKIKI